MTVRKIDMMHKLFGFSADDDDRCKDCCHLQAHMMSRRYYKCECYGETASAASDWKVSNRACGLYNGIYEGRPVIYTVKPEKPPESPIKGQIGLFDEQSM